MKAKAWNTIVLVGTFGVLIIIAIFTIIVDPFLHYHKPLEGLEYPLNDLRYQNDGISQWYDYDAIIVGTSMTQNFKVSELESLTGKKAVKITYSGASFHEIRESVERALSYNPDVKMILCSMDNNRLNYPKDKDEYEDYPEYLYDNNLFNDVNYVLNKEVVPKTIAVINYTRAGNKTPSMDEYGSWDSYKFYGKEIVRGTLGTLPQADTESALSEEDIQCIKENVTCNYLELALEYPEIEFFFFSPPYSICYWEALHKTKQLSIPIQAEKITVQILLQADNVHVFSFFDRLDILSNLDNYTDSLHYSGEINSQILKMIYTGQGELTLENYEEYYERLEDIYYNYDYESIWKD